jgi:purine-binding chemotaxis protein CheW
VAEETSVKELSGQYLSFKLDEELFAINVASIREIIDRTETTRIPRMPGYMCGVTNLRGSVVPVVDMRMKFGLGHIDRTIDTCIVVLEIQIEGESTIVGALVDSVKEVFELSSDMVEPPPKIGAKLNTEFMIGMGRLDDEFLILLDVDRVFSVDELEAVQSVTDAVRRKGEKKPAKAKTENASEAIASAESEG